MAICTRGRQLLVTKIGRIFQRKSLQNPYIVKNFRNIRPIIWCFGRTQSVNSVRPSRVYCKNSYKSFLPLHENDPAMHYTYLPCSFLHWKIIGFLNFILSLRKVGKFFNVQCIFVERLKTLGASICQQVMYHTIPVVISSIKISWC